MDPTRTAVPVPARAPAVTCDLGALTAPDLAVVDALARLRLAAGRHGVGVVLLNAGGPLRELLAFSGLAALLPGPVEDLPAVPAVPDGLLDGLLDGLVEGLPDGLVEELLGRGKAGREAEQREQHVRVEEVGEPGDPAL
ncbi:STAS domain-containing protein [Kitasatospora sp. NPDC051170]|uniref:STAS domain-containing protein n=1 Tax=Kitasatospora sp. NPDC051170 TaxID=3364056 RepID=UPI0037B27BC6